MFFLIFNFWFLAQGVLKTDKQSLRCVIEIELVMLILVSKYTWSLFPRRIYRYYVKSNEWRYKISTDTYKH